MMENGQTIFCLSHKKFKKVVGEKNVFSEVLLKASGKKKKSRKAMAEPGSRKSSAYRVGGG